MPRLSILLICHSYPPVLGGSEMEAQRVCAALRKRGYTVKVVASGGAPMPPGRDWVDPEGTPVRTYGGGFTSKWRDRVYAAGVAWTLLTQSASYDLVYFLMQGLHLAAGLPTARFLNKPMVMKVSGSGIISEMRKSRLGRLELRWLRQWAGRVMVLNAGMMSEAAAAGFAPAQLLWMPNPVDVAEFSPASPGEKQQLRRRLELPADAPVALYVGRLAPEKELDSLLDAFALVVRQVPDALLALVGDGPLRESLAAHAQRLGVSANVRFPGRIPSGEVRHWLRAGDVFTLVSSLEGFSCSLAEAMATGLPSVVSGIPANRQLVEDGRHGYTAPVRDVRAIAEALQRLLSHPELRQTMGAESRRLVESNYSIDRVIDRYEDLFAESMRKRNP